jgi:hypothetical protein
VFIIRQIEDVFYLVNSTTFESANRNNDNIPCFIAQRESDGHFSTISSLDGQFHNLIILGSLINRTQHPVSVTPEEKRPVLQRNEKIYTHTSDDEISKNKMTDKVFFWSQVSNDKITVNSGDLVILKLCTSQPKRFILVGVLELRISKAKQPKFMILILDLASQKALRWCSMSNINLATHDSSGDHALVMERLLKQLANNFMADNSAALKTVLKYDTCTQVGGVYDVGNGYDVGNDV